MHGITGLALVTTMQQLTMKRYTNVKREINIGGQCMHACYSYCNCVLNSVMGMHSYN